MPDANKLAVLKGHQYQVLTTCGVCIRGQFVSGSMWGSCSMMKYQHLKHSEIKLASIYATGTCPKGEMHPDTKVNLARSGFDIFVPDGASS